MIQNVRSSGKLCFIELRDGSGYIQTPELHSIHHELDIHAYNYSDIPLRDRVFGIYKDTTTFAEKCGFPNHNERKIRDMLLFRDVYKDKEESKNP